MVKNITIRQIHTNTLACEPIVRRTANGELLCLCQCDGVTEPAKENRVYAFHSKDNGLTWTNKENIYPEDGLAAYCTEVSVIGEEITAYLSVHLGRFLDWKCVMMKSFDSGYTWENAGEPPFFPEYTFIRGTIHTKDGVRLIPYQSYPVTREERDRIMNDDSITDKLVCLTNTPYCESGVIWSGDGGKTFEKHIACRQDIPQNMPYGGTEHNNFTVSGYHSYALLMAMDKSATPAERYALVERLNLGLSAGDTFETQLGDYSVTAIREGASVSFLFENQLLMSSHDPITPGEDDIGEGESDEEEGEYLG